MTQRLAVNHDADLSALREAAAAREWVALQEILTRLLMELEFFAGLEIALNRAYGHLPVFESHHPDDGWARSLLVWIASYGAAPANLPLEAGSPHDSPGAGNFITALIEIARSVERRTPLENRIRFLSNALCNIMLADLMNFWYSQYPAIWELQQERGDELDPETGLTIRQGIYAQFWLDESVAQRDQAAWSQIAAQLEDRLSRQSSPR